MEELRDHAEPDIVIMLVGNKVDLANNKAEARRVTKAEGENFAKLNGLLFEETSAVTVVRVKEAFENLLQAIYNNKAKNGNLNEKTGNSNKLAQNLNASTQKSVCC